MHHIIIVGGGISGLYLAYLLSSKTSKKVMIPMDIAIEWVQALIDSKIYIDIY